MYESKLVNNFKDGLESRDFANVKDITDKIIAFLDNDKSHGGTMKLGSGVNTSVFMVYCVEFILTNQYL